MVFLESVETMEFMESMDFIVSMDSVDYLDSMASMHRPCFTFSFAKHKTLAFLQARVLWFVMGSPLLSCLIPEFAGVNPTTGGRAGPKTQHGRPTHELAGGFHTLACGSVTSLRQQHVGGGSCCDEELQ